MRDATLLFLVKRNADSEIVEICLAMKKRGFGVGRWNGVGGKIEVGEAIESAAKREAEEEVGVKVQSLMKVAELTFLFPAKPEWDQLVHAYLCDVWTGEPTETEEMRPEWRVISDIPFAQMWADDVYWLPQVLAGVKVKATFSFGEHDEVLSQDVLVVSSL